MSMPWCTVSLRPGEGRARSKGLGHEDPLIRKELFKLATPHIEKISASFLSNKWPMALWVAFLLSVDLVNADKLSGRTRKYKVIFSPQKVSVDSGGSGIR